MVNLKTSEGQKLYTYRDISDLAEETKSSVLVNSSFDLHVWFTRYPKLAMLMQIRSVTLKNCNVGGGKKYVDRAKFYGWRLGLDLNLSFK